MKNQLLFLILFGIALGSQAEAQSKKILFFGDSITAGYGIDSDLAFPALIEQKIDSLDLSYTVVNAGLSGETSAGGLRRIDWVLQQGVDIFVLELGGNDGLRGISPSSTKESLQGIIDKVNDSHPNAQIILTGMQAPPNMGQTYTNEFKSIFDELAESNDVIYLPFILEGVAGDPNLNQSDGIHPTEEGHQILAENVWDVLEPIL